MKPEDYFQQALKAAAKKFDLKLSQGKSLFR